MPDPVGELTSRKLREAEERIRKAHQDAVAALEREKEKAIEEIRQRLSRAAEEFASYLS